ncbi:MAG: efflux RND transporter periplasmic adaptor subunit [Spirochaetota bacterium]
MRKKIIYGIIIIVGIVAVYRIGTFVMDKINPEAKKEEVRTVPVKATAVIRKDMVDSIKLTGDIIGTEVVNVFSRVPGKVEEILVKEGQKVWKGQTVIKVNRDIVGMDYMPAIVESPINGYVGSLMVDRGMSIASSTALAQVVNMSSVEAVVQLMEEDINRVQPGMTAKIGVEAFPGRAFAGRVYKKSAVLNAASRTQEVHILINNPGTKLKHGMFADVEIILGRRKNVLAVPVDAVMRDERESAYVYVVEKDIARRKMIETGLTVDNFTEVKSGLGQDAVVVTLGKENISDGEHLKVYREDQPNEEKNVEKSKSEDVK